MRIKVSALTPNAFSNRIAMSADSAVWPLKRLLRVWRVTWKAAARRAVRVDDLAFQPVTGVNREGRMQGHGHQ